MEEIFIEDIHSKFNKENFDKFVENNLLNMSKDLVSYVKNANQNKDLYIFVHKNIYFIFFYILILSYLLFYLNFYFKYFFLGICILYSF